MTNSKRTDRLLQKLVNLTTTSQVLLQLKKQGSLLGFQMDMVGDKGGRGGSQGQNVLDMAHQKWWKGKRWRNRNVKAWGKRCSRMHINWILRSFRSPCFLEFRSGLVLGLEEIKAALRWTCGDPFSIVKRTSNTQMHAGQHVLAINLFTELAWV